MFGRIKDEHSPHWHERIEGAVPADAYPCAEGYPTVTAKHGIYGEPGYRARIFQIIVVRTDAYGVSTFAERVWATVEWDVIIDGCPAWRSQRGPDYPYISYMSVAAWSSVGLQYR